MQIFGYVGFQLMFYMLGKPNGSGTTPTTSASASPVTSRTGRYLDRLMVY